MAPSIDPVKLILGPQSAIPINSALSAAIFQTHEDLTGLGYKVSLPVTFQRGGKEILNFPDAPIVALQFGIGGSFGLLTLTKDQLTTPINFVVVPEQSALFVNEKTGAAYINSCVILKDGKLEAVKFDSLQEVKLVDLGGWNQLSARRFFDANSIPQMVSQSGAELYFDKTSVARILNKANILTPPCAVVTSRDSKEDIDAAIKDLINTEEYKVSNCLVVKPNELGSGKGITYIEGHDQEAIEHAIKEAFSVGDDSCLIQPYISSDLWRDPKQQIAFNLRVLTTWQLDENGTWTPYTDKDSLIVRYGPALKGPLNTQLGAKADLVDILYQKLQLPLLEIDSYIEAALEISKKATQEIENVLAAQQKLPYPQALVVGWDFQPGPNLTWYVLEGNVGCVGAYHIIQKLNEERNSTLIPFANCLTQALSVADQSKGRQFYTPDAYRESLREVIKIDDLTACLHIFRQLGFTKVTPEILAFSKLIYEKHKDSSEALRNYCVFLDKAEHYDLVLDLLSDEKQILAILSKLDRHALLAVRANALMMTGDLVAAASSLLVLIEEDTKDAKAQFQFNLLVSATLPDEEVEASLEELNLASEYSLNILIAYSVLLIREERFDQLFNKLTVAISKNPQDSKLYGIVSVLGGLLQTEQQNALINAIAETRVGGEFYSNDRLSALRLRFDISRDKIFSNLKVDTLSLAPSGSNQDERLEFPQVQEEQDVVLENIRAIVPYLCH